jgi:hypothetical protein
VAFYFHLRSGIRICKNGMSMYMLCSNNLK